MQTEKDILAAVTNSESTTTPTTEAEVPQEVSDAFDAIFNSEEGGGVAVAEKPVATEAQKATHKQSEEENAEELEGLETSEVDGEKEPEIDEKKEPVVKDDKEPESKPEEKEGDAPTLSPLLRQAAKRNGWTEEEINDLYQLNPEKAEQSFERLLESYNKLSAVYGRLGAEVALPVDGTPRPNPQQPQPAFRPQPAPAAAPSAAREILQEVFGKEKLAVLKDKYDEGFVEDALKPMAESFMNQIETVVGPLQQQVQQYEQAQVRQQCNGFLKGLGKDFGEFYGEGQDVQKLTQEQYDRRSELFSETDNIRAGMQLRGLNPDLAECLDRAHMQVAHNHMATVERKRIQQSVKKRSQGITHRPSQRKKLKVPGEQSEAEAIAAFDNAATEMGWES